MRIYLYPLLALAFFVGCQASPEVLTEQEKVVNQARTAIEASVSDEDRDMPALVDYEHMYGQPQGPWNNYLFYSRTTADGHVTTTQEFFTHSAVPSMVTLQDGTILAAFQWFPRSEWFDYVAIARSMDNGFTWNDPQPIALYEYPEEFSNPFDPTVVLTEDGRVRMYFTAVEGMRGPDAESRIYSAISEDGFSYTFEPGVRFVDTDHTRTRDAAVVRFNDEWHLYTPDHEQIGRVNHAVSQDGLAFETKDDLEFDNFNWLGNVIERYEAMHFYGDIGGEVRRLVSEDGYNWDIAATVFGGPTDITETIIGSDAAVAEMNGGDMLYVFTRPQNAPTLSGTKIDVQMLNTPLTIKPIGGPVVE